MPPTICSEPCTASHRPEVCEFCREMQAKEQAQSRAEWRSRAWERWLEAFEGDRHA